MHTIYHNFSFFRDCAASIKIKTALISWRCPPLTHKPSYFSQQNNSCNISFWKKTLKLLPHLSSLAEFWRKFLFSNPCRLPLLYKKAQFWGPRKTGFWEENWPGRGGCMGRKRERRMSKAKVTITKVVPPEDLPSKFSLSRGPSLQESKHAKDLFLDKWFSWHRFRALFKGKVAEG